MSYNFANNQTSTFGLSPNAAALISYLWIPITSIIVLVTEKENRLVRFHAFQSLFLGLGIFAFTIILSIIIGILTLVAGAVSPYAGIIVSVLSLLVWMVIAIALVGLWVLCLVKAYRGEMYKLPIVGSQAEKMVNK
ncbi:MAG TPA: hypothetical protein VGC97_01585 [Pyrinomonadaceae bacterium]|jgi:uncharacterized membrane protein